MFSNKQVFIKFHECKLWKSYTQLYTHNYLTICVCLYPHVKFRYLFFPGAAPFRAEPTERLAALAVPLAELWMEADHLTNRKAG